MKKKILAMLLTLTMLMPILSACGNDLPDETESDTDVQETVGGEEISDTVDLVTDGVSEYVIVRGENASEYEIKAASELQSYLLKITGAELPIVTDTAAAAEKEIVVGLTNREADGAYDRTELAEDGFILETESQKLWIIGGERAGTLYGVYEFLESYLGCRFYTAELEKVPEAKNISLSIAEDKQIPVFEIRQDYWHGVDANSAFFDKLKLRNPVWAGSSCHTLPGLSENGGDGSFGPDPCLQSEEVFQTVLKNVRALLAANPNARFISVSQADNSEAESKNYCQCEKCTAYEAENGVSANYLQFVNRIAGEIKDEYPNVMVHTFAYKRSLEPPKSDIQVADNVFIQICTHDCCFNHPLVECDYSARVEEGQNMAAFLERWGEICKYISVWDYTQNFNVYNLPFPNLDVLWQNVILFADNNVRFLFEQGAHNWVSNGEFAELKAYLLGKLLWDPYMGEEKYYALMDEFLADYYGPGWESIRAYIDYTEEITENYHMRMMAKPEEVLQITYGKRDNSKPVPYLTADTLRNYKDIDWSQYYGYFTPYTFGQTDWIEKGYAFFEAAMQAAETEEQRTRLDKSSIHLDILNMYYWKFFLLRVAYSDIGVLYEGCLKLCLEDGSMTQEEADALKASFKTDMRDPILEKGRTMLEEVKEKLLSYGMTYVGGDKKTEGWDGNFN